MKKGDKVEWTHRSRRGKLVSFTQRYGVVVDIDGEEVIVQRGKKQIRLPIDQVQVAGSGPNQLDEFVSGVVEAYNAALEKEEDDGEGTVE